MQHSFQQFTRPSHAPPNEIRHTQSYSIKAKLSMYFSPLSLITTYTHSGLPCDTVSICLLAKAEVQRHKNGKVVTFCRYYTLMEQSIKISSVYIITHELLLTLFLNSNSSNRAMFLFAQMPFDASKQSVCLRACTAQVCWCAKSRSKVC